MKPNPDNITYSNLVDLLSIHADAANRLAEINADLQHSFLLLVDEHKDDFAKLQQILTDTEASIIAIAQANPQWFAQAKTVKTPYGSVHSRSTTSLSVPNEEATVLLIEKHFTNPEEFIRTTKTLNLEALEQLDEADLRTIRVKRVREESITVKASKVDLGKAVKDAEKTTKKEAA